MPASVAGSVEGSGVPPPHEHERTKENEGAETIVIQVVSETKDDADVEDGCLVWSIWLLVKFLAAVFVFYAVLLATCSLLTAAAVGSGGGGGGGDDEPELVGPGRQHRGVPTPFYSDFSSLTFQHQQDQPTHNGPILVDMPQLFLRGSESGSESDLGYPNQRIRGAGVNIEFGSGSGSGSGKQGAQRAADFQPAESNSSTASPPPPPSPRKGPSQIDEMASTFYSSPANVRLLQQMQDMYYKAVAQLDDMGYFEDPSLGGGSNVSREEVTRFLETVNNVQERRSAEDDEAAGSHARAKRQAAAAVERLVTPFIVSMFGSDKVQHQNELKYPDTGLSLRPFAPRIPFQQAVCSALTCCYLLPDQVALPCCGLLGMQFRLHLDCCRCFGMEIVGLETMRAVS